MVQHVDEEYRIEVTRLERKAPAAVSLNRPTCIFPALEVDPVHTELGPGRTQEVIHTPVSASHVENPQRSRRQRVGEESPQPPRPAIGNVPLVQTFKQIHG